MKRTPPIVLSRLAVAGTATVVGLVALPAGAQAATFVVDTTSDVTAPLDGATTLREAMAAAALSPGADVIDLTGVSGSIALTGATALPAIAQDLTIVGPGADLLTVTRDAAAGANRFFSITAGTVDISGLTLTNGSATTGGAILVSAGVLTLHDAALVGNVTTGTGATDGGGGLSVAGGTVTVTDCTLSGNTSANRGGGAQVVGGTLTIENSTIADNSSTASSGGVTVNGNTAALHLSFVTIFNNTTNGQTGGVRVNAGSCDYVSSAITGNAGTQVTTGGGGCTNLGTAASSYINATGSGLAALADNGGATLTCAISTGSPLIDAAGAAGLLTTDQRGETRSADGNGDGTATPDIGAYEAIFTPPPVLLLDTAPLTYTENDAALFLNTTGSATQEGVTTFDGATLGVALTAGQAAGDALSLLDNAAAGVTVAGDVVAVDGVDVGTFVTGGAGLGIQVSLGAAATPDAVGKLLQAFAFSSTSEDLSTTPRVIRFRLTDAAGVAGTDQTRSITTVAVNDAPTVVASAIPVGTEDTTLTINLTVSDVDSPVNSITLEGVSLTPSLVADTGLAFAGINANRTLRVTPEPNAFGPGSVRVSASDGADTSTLDVPLLFTNTNDAPVTLDTPVSVDEDGAVDFDLLAEDPDGDPLTYLVVIQPTHGTVTGTPPALHYVPEADYAGPDSIGFAVTDGTLLSPIGYAAVTVNPVNDPPTATGSALQTDEDVPLLFAFVASDIDGTTPTIVIDRAPSLGQLVLGTGLDATYVPDPNVSGIDTFDFHVTDGTVDTALLTTIVTIHAVNDGPVAEPLALTTDEDVAVVLPFAATDPEGDAVSFVPMAGPAHGQVIESGGVFTYLPYPDYAGPDTFGYAATDGTTMGAEVLVTVDVLPLNDAPRTTDPQEVTVDEDQSLTFTLAAVDPEGDPIQYELLDGPSPGTLVAFDNTTGDVTYQTLLNFSGEDTFTWFAGDGLANSPVSTVIVHVVPVDDDDDGDGILDSLDNCPLTPNIDQADGDLDGVGDACDVDADNDGVEDSVDNCVNVANSDQANLDGDAEGDACDTDADGDGVGADADCNDLDGLVSAPILVFGDLDRDGFGTGGGLLLCALVPTDGTTGVPGDNCPDVANADQIDLDGDTVGDACDDNIDGDAAANADDNCVFIANDDQTDLDADGTGDACDDDRDGDEIANADDNCPDTDNADQLDADGDGAGDLCDADDDNDTVPDAADNCPLVANTDQADLNRDGIGDACADDTDGDGVANLSDNCPVAANADQTDTDSDGAGDVCDADDDGDGIDDITDACPLEAAATTDGCPAPTDTGTDGGDGDTGVVGDTDLVADTSVIDDTSTGDTAVVDDTSTGDTAVIDDTSTGDTSTGDTSVVDDTTPAEDTTPSEDTSTGEDTTPAEDTTPSEDTSTGEDTTVAEDTGTVGDTAPADTGVLADTGSLDFDSGNTGGGADAVSEVDAGTTGKSKSDGCSAAGGSIGSLGWLGLSLLALARRRRRS